MTGVIQERNLHVRSLEGTVSEDGVTKNFVSSGCFLRPPDLEKK